MPCITRLHHGQIGNFLDRVCIFLALDAIGWQPEPVLVNSLEVTRKGSEESGICATWEWSEHEQLACTEWVECELWFKQISVFCLLMLKPLNYSVDFFTTHDVLAIICASYLGHSICYCWLVFRSWAMVVLFRQLLSQLQHCVCTGTVLVAVGGAYDEPVFPFMWTFCVKVASSYWPY